MSATDAVQVSIEVAADPATAFDVFTSDVDAWWKHGARYRPVAPYAGTMRFEPGEGGRLVHVEEATGSSFEVGRIRAWEPGVRLAFSWRLPNFAPDQRTEVDVRFEAVPAGTRVVLTHSGWDALPATHPVRHGLVGQAGTMMRGGWWADLLGSLKQRAEHRPSEPAT